MTAFRYRLNATLSKWEWHGNVGAWGEPMLFMFLNEIAQAHGVAVDDIMIAEGDGGVVFEYVPF